MNNICTKFQLSNPYRFREIAVDGQTDGHKSNQINFYFFRHHIYIAQKIYQEEIFLCIYGVTDVRNIARGLLSLVHL